MKIKLYSVSGYKVDPGHGRRYARTNRKVFQFLNAKCELAFLSKRNPFPLSKKAQKETVRRNSKEKDLLCKSQRAITGASVANIVARRNQKPEVRKAQKQALRAVKEAKKDKQASKKTAMAATKAPTKAAPKQRSWSL